MTVKYAEDHEWIKVEGGTATIGITKYAAEQLGDVVFVELPDVGKTLTKGGDAAVVESVKAASDVIAPVSGDVVEVNTVLTDNPEAVNTDPEGEGWFIKVTLSDASEMDSLMDEAAYKAFVDGL